MGNFKSSTEHVTGAKIVENGVEKDIIILKPLVKVGETKTACYLANDAAALLNTLASDTDFTGYHVATTTELTALCNMLTKQYEENPWPNSTMQARSYLYWKPKEEIPGNITGPEYVRQILGFPMDGYEIYDAATDTITRTMEGTSNGFWTADTLNSTIKRPLICTDPGAMGLQMQWGSNLERIMYSILMVKNRD